MTEVGTVPVSPREVEVLDALADRLTNKEIAERLVLSVRTVETHVAALLRKLGAGNRRELAEIGRDRRSRQDAAPARRLPTPLTRFVGREAEFAGVADACRVHRLVTIAGPPGVGKTRLAIEFARSMLADDVAFVDLAPQRNSVGAWEALASALDVPEAPGRGLRRIVVDRLTASPTLLVLDNCEHVIEAAAEVASQLLDATTGTRILATSRERLGIPGEQILGLTPLAVPDEDDESLSGQPAVQLFVDRATAADGEFRLDAPTARSVASICRHLDGVPLALELAAAQVPALTPAQIDGRLGNRFRLLRAPIRGSMTRHRALDTAVAWSWDLLSTRERALLDRLSVFRGTISLEAVEAVASGPPVEAGDVLDLLVSLVRKSLVVPQLLGTDRRYRLLETIREFGLRRLQDAGELGMWRERHRTWTFNRMREAADGLACGVVPKWLDALDAELDNMEAALEWSVSTPEGAAEALPVVRGLEHYWMARGVRRAHGVRWSTTAAERATGVDAAARVEGLLGAVLLVMWSDVHAARVLADKAADLAAATGDRTGTGYAALAQAWVGAFTGEAADAVPLAATAADCISETDPVRPWLPLTRAMIAAGTDRLAKAVKQVLESAESFLAHDDPHMYGGVLSIAADFQAAQGDVQGARYSVERSLEEARASDCASCASQAAASFALIEEDPSVRLNTARQAVRLADDIGETWGVLCGLEVVSAALADTGALADAALLAAATRAARAATGMVSVLPGRAAELARAEAAALAGLGNDAYSALSRDGAGLDYVSAVAHALG